jgi:hypothetical protein
MICSNTISKNIATVETPCCTLPVFSDFLLWKPGRDTRDTRDPSEATLRKLCIIPPLSAHYIDIWP